MLDEAAVLEAVDIWLVQDHRKMKGGEGSPRFGGQRLGPRPLGTKVPHSIASIQHTQTFCPCLGSGLAICYFCPLRNLTAK